MTKDKMVGWHHQLNEHESEQTQGDTRRQGGLVHCSLWGREESDTTEQLNNNNLYEEVQSVQFSHSVVSNSF